MKPAIVFPDAVGKNNADLDKAALRVESAKMYRDLSTVIICPTRGLIPARVVQSWMRLMRPPNQRIQGPIFAEGMKVDKAYEEMISAILNHNILGACKYILTIEEDNIPPPDGLLKLYKNIDDYDVIGGLYWAKGENGFPMIYGDPSDPDDYTPQVPRKGEIQACNGLGMGFNLFKMDMFRKIPQPWFNTLQEYEYGYKGGITNYTQDLYFYKKAAEYGYKFACDNNVLVGHYDFNTNVTW